MQTADKIRAYISEQLLFDDGSRSIANDTPLFGGVIDSIGLIELVGFLEKDFGIQIDDADLTAENFESVTTIADLVTRLGNET
jgi:acyl carrier protein